jgi:hypothetical protein
MPDAGPDRCQLARVLILTRLWAEIPYPVQVRAPSAPSRRARSHPYCRLSADPAFAAAAPPWLP